MPQTPVLLDRLLSTWSVVDKCIYSSDIVVICCKYIRSDISISVNLINHTTKNTLSSIEDDKGFFRVIAQVPRALIRRNMVDTCYNEMVISL